MGVSESIVIGVVSGILTSFFIWFLVHVFNEYFIPWYQGMVYQGINIAGTWKGFYEGKARPYSLINMKQSGHSIEGEQVINLHPYDEKVDSPKVVLLKGTFSDSVLVLTYEPKDKSRLGRGGIVMRLGEDGQVFEGTCAYANAEDGNITEKNERWVREEGK